jgi:hypothetical protein
MMTDIYNWVRVSSSMMRSSSFSSCENTFVILKKNNTLSTGSVRTLP